MTASAYSATAGSCIVQGSKKGILYAGDLLEEMQEIKENLKGSFADEFSFPAPNEWLKRLFEPFEALFARPETMTGTKKSILG